MIEIITTYKYNIILGGAFFLLLLLFLFPVEKSLSKIFKTEVKKTTIFLILILFSLAVLAKYYTFGFVLSFPMILFSIFVFLFGFLSNRKYIYLLSLVFLILTPVFLAFKIKVVADFLSQGFYLLLILGVLKDIFYEKIFE